MSDISTQTQILTRRTRHTGRHFYEPLNTETQPVGCVRPLTQIPKLSQL